MCGGGDVHRLCTTGVWVRLKGMVKQNSRKCRTRKSVFKAIAKPRTGYCNAFRLVVHGGLSDDMQSYFGIIILFHNPI